MSISDFGIGQKESFSRHYHKTNSDKIIFPELVLLIVIA